MDSAFRVGLSRILQIYDLDILGVLVPGNTSKANFGWFKIAGQGFLDATGGMRRDRPGSQNCEGCGVC